MADKEDDGGGPSEKQLAKLVQGIWFDPKVSKYYLQNRRKDWVGYSGAIAEMELKTRGVSDDAPGGMGLSLLERVILEIQKDRDIDFAGEIAGMGEGMLESFGNRVLVTRGPKLPKPEKGEWTHLETLFDSLLEKQVDHWHGWVRSARLSVKHGIPYLPGQALILVGRSGNGKGVLQTVLTEILGGRQADPFQFFMGESTFNDHMVAAEHLSMEDKAASKDMRSRKTFGTAIKGAIANHSYMCYPKGRKPFNCQPFWRITISVNDEPENMMVLPPVDNSMKDKLMMLSTKQAKFPYEAGDLVGRKRYAEALKKEVPAYLYWLAKYKIPEAMVDLRYGVKAFQDPQILQILAELDPENRLLELIEDIIFDSEATKSWLGSAADLEKALREAQGREAVGSLFNYQGASGTLLRKLSMAFPERCRRRRGKGNTSRWEIVREGWPFDDLPKEEKLDPERN